MSAKNSLDDISTESVAKFLKDNPDFFNNRDDLLTQLELPHRAGGAISLVERQVNVLRERNMDMRQRFSHMLDAARDNDRLFEKTRLLILALLEAPSLEELMISINEEMRNHFQGDATALILTQSVGNDAIRHLSEEESETLGALLQNRQPLCGALREGEIEALFPDAKNIKSAATIPVTINGNRGIFAVGSRDSKKFVAGMGTLFISYIAEVVERLVSKELA